MNRNCLLHPDPRPRDPSLFKPGFDMKIILTLIGLCTVAQARPMHPAQLPTPRESLDQRAGSGSPVWGARRALPTPPLLVNPGQILTGLNPQLLLIQAQESKAQSLESQLQRQELRLAQLRQVIEQRQDELRKLQNSDEQEAKGKRVEGEEQLKVLRAAMKEVTERLEKARKELKLEQNRNRESTEAEEEASRENAAADRQAQLLAETKRRLAASQKLVEERVAELVAQQKELETKNSEQDRKAVERRKVESQSRRSSEQQRREPAEDRKRADDERAAAQKKIKELKKIAEKKRAEAEAMKAAADEKRAETVKSNHAHSYQWHEDAIKALRAELHSAQSKLSERHPTVLSLRKRLEMTLANANKQAIVQQRAHREHQHGLASDLLEKELHELERRHEQLSDKLKHVRDGGTREELLAEFNRVRAMEGRVRFQLRSINEDREEEHKHDGNEGHHRHHDDEEEHGHRHHDGDDAEHHEHDRRRHDDDEEHGHRHHDGDDAEHHEHDRRRHDDDEEHGHRHHDDDRSEHHEHDRRYHDEEEHEHHGYHDHEHHEHDVPDRERDYIHGRIEALMHASEVLARSGLQDQAQELRRQAEELERELHGHRGHHEEAVGELMENVEILRGEVRELHEKMDLILQLLRQRPTGAATWGPNVRPGAVAQPGDGRVWSREARRIEPQPRDDNPKNGGVRVYRYMPREGAKAGTWMYHLKAEERADAAKRKATDSRLHGDRDTKRPLPKKESGSEKKSEAKEVRREVHVIKVGEDAEDVRVIELKGDTGAVRKLEVIESREPEEAKEIEVEVEVIESGKSDAGGEKPRPKQIF